MPMTATSSIEAAGKTYDKPSPMRSTTGEPGDEQSLQPGTRVEVRDRFRGAWAHGYEIAEVAEAGYRVRRLSDNTLLPATFSGEEVRTSRRRQGLWWW